MRCLPVFGQFPKQLLARRAQLMERARELGILLDEVPRVVAHVVLDRAVAVTQHQHRVRPDFVDVVVAGLADVLRTLPADYVRVAEGS